MWKLGRMAAALATATAFAAIAGCHNNQAPSSPAPEPAKLQIGGMPLVTLARHATPNANQPQFISITIIPGRGMDVYQIGADLPGKGEIPVLWAPTFEQLKAKMTDRPPDDLDGDASFSCCAPFLVPYPNRILGKLSPDGKTVTTEWHGKKIVLPANWHATSNPGKDKNAMHGLILDAKTEDVQTHDIPDGQSVTGVIHAGNFGGHWLSSTDLDFTISLTGNAVDAVVVAKNVGSEAEPISIGWHPYFRIPSGNRRQALLHVPGDRVAVVNNYDDVFPTGKLLPVKGTKWDFLAPQGKPLDDAYYDDNWSSLQRTKGAVQVSLVDPGGDYGVRLSGLSPDIRTVQVYSPPSANFAVIEEQFNFADPFGKEWHGMNTGMVTLKPGQSVEWHVRLELFRPSQNS